MAVRVTEADVEKLIDVDSFIDVDPFITAANLIVDEVLSGEGYTDAYLTEIERWLAAHLVAMRQRQITGEDYGEAGVKYGGKFGVGLDFTQYGQQVKILDTSGKLASTGKPKIKFHVIAL